MINFAKYIMIKLYTIINVIRVEGMCIMEARKRNKKYFLKDSELINIDDDRFNQKDVVNNLRIIIENTNPPYNIALIGKWGIGKSSIINLLLNKYKKDKNNYIVQEINAWKYEKESLKNVFLKQLWQGISGEKVKTFETIKRIYRDVISKDSSEKNPRFKKLMWVFGIISAILLIISTIAFIIYKAVQLGGIVDGFWKEVFLSYCRNIGKVMIVPLILSFSTVILSEFIKKYDKKIEVKIPIETTDDYESFLEDTINKELGQNKNKKIITIIDDLDRLSIDKIVEALDAIKAFVGFKNCIFIVPFDDSILKKALDENRTIKLDGNHQIVESELILDKLFQYKIYIPPLLSFDIKEYAVNLVKDNIPDFIEEYCSIDLFEKIIRKVLIHKNVTTPRQVKKLINTFVNNKILITNRSKNGKIEEKLLNIEESDLQLAKISVLQADFNDFYDVLFGNFDYINRIIDYHEGNYRIDEIDEDLKIFFESKKDKENEGYAEIKREHEPLINFLKQTEKYKVENIAPFMYLIQDDISIKTGDENNRRMISAMESRNEKTVRKMIEENSNIIESITYELENAEGIELLNDIITIINSFDSISEDNKLNIAENLSEKIYNLNKTKEEINILDVNLNNLFSILKLVNKKENINETLNKYLDNSKENNNLEKNIEIINKYLEEKESLENNICENLKNFIQKVIEQNTEKINIFIEKVKIKNGDIFEEYFGNELLNTLCKYIDVSNDFSDTILSKFKEYFVELDKNNKIMNSISNISMLFKYNKLLETLNTLFTEKLCDNINEDNSTEIANIIVNANSQDKTNALSLLNKMNFNIDEDNYEQIDKYLQENLEQKTTQDIIIKILDKDVDNIEYLEQSVDTLIESVFNGEEYDEFFGRIIKYLTNELLEGIFKKLTSLSAYNSSKDYSREKQIFKYLCIKENEAHITDFIKNTIIKNYKSYSSYKIYFNYTYEMIIYAKEYISEDVLEEYLKLVISAYDNYPERAILFFKLLKSTIPNSIMELLVPKLNSNLTTTSYEDTFYILRNKREFFSEDNNNLNEYRNFLVNNIKLSENPNEVIDALDEYFSKISKIYELYNNIRDIDDINYDKAFKFMGKILDNYELSNVIDNLNKILENEESVEDTLKIESKMKKYTLDDLIKENCNNLDNISNNILIKNMIELSSFKQKSLEPIFVLKLIEKAMHNIDDVEYIIGIDQLLGKFERLYFNENEKELNNILYNCFNTTTSDTIRISIMRRIPYFKITRMFKNKMDDEEKNFYNDNVV